MQKPPEARHYETRGSNRMASDLLFQMFSTEPIDRHNLRALCAATFQQIPGKSPILFGRYVPVITRHVQSFGKINFTVPASVGSTDPRRTDSVQVSNTAIDRARMSLCETDPVLTTILSIIVAQPAGPEAARSRGRATTAFVASHRQIPSASHLPR